MKVYESKDIRNVGVVGHGDSGKTTLTAGLLFTSGASNRLLRVDEGNTITDFDDEEIARKITIATSIAVAEWKKAKSTSSIRPATTYLLMTLVRPWSPRTLP
ncbi:MAG: GTP-binding protein [Ignavibacteriota bacterium]